MDEGSSNSLYVRVEVDLKQLKKVVAALKKESDGKELARDFVQQLKAVAVQVLADVKSEIMSMHSLGETSPPLRATVARHTKISVRTTGKRPGVSLITKKTGMPREFANAPQRLNKVSFRHPLFGQRGSGKWFTQIGKPNWFDGPAEASKPVAVAAAVRVLEGAKQRLAERGKI